MSFIKEFKRGQKGLNKGISLGKGLKNISDAIGGSHKGTIYGFAGAPKTGKSTLVDYAFVLQPYMHFLKLGKLDLLKIIYFSLEMNKVEKQFSFVAFFLYEDYGIKYIKLPKGKKFKGENRVEMSAKLLRGRVYYDKEEGEEEKDRQIIKIPVATIKIIKLIYNKHIINLFGGVVNKVKKKGVITFVTKRSTREYYETIIHNHAENLGECVYQDDKIIEYKPLNEKVITYIITDHVRKIKLKKGESLKTTVDEYSAMTVEMANLFNFSFIHIIHLNRSIGDMGRKKAAKDRLFPTPDDVKDSGNIAEDCDHLFTLMSPNDDQYNLTYHFGVQIKNQYGHALYPNLKSIHLVQSRHTDFPQHFTCIMLGANKTFKQLKID